MKLIGIRGFYIIFCLLVLSLSMVACVKKAEAPRHPTSLLETIPSNTGTAPHSTTSLTAEDVDLPADGWHMPEIGVTYAGAYGAGGYYDEYDGILTFTDLSNGTKVVLCSKPGCLHYDEPEEKKVDCDAYIGFAFSFHYQDGKLYYVSYRSPDDNYLYLMQRNADGTEEKTIGRLASKYATKETSVTVTQYIFAEDALYYRADVMRLTQNEAETAREKTEFHLMRMELNGGKDETLEEYRLTEAPLLLGARSNMLLYYTVPLLTREEQNSNPNLIHDKPSSLKVWVNEVAQSVTLFTYKFKEYSGSGPIVNGKYYYRYYYNPETSEYRYKTFDLETQQHKDAELKVLPEINGRYAICDNKETSHANYLFDTLIGEPVPMDYCDVRLVVLKTNEEGFMLQIFQKAQNESGKWSIVSTEYRYIRFAELEDGLQKTDGILMTLM